MWPGFRWLLRVWYACGLVLVCLAPIIMSEITVLLPLAMVFAFAAGPLHGLANEKPTCRTCGAVITSQLRVVAGNSSAIAHKRHKGDPPHG